MSARLIASSGGFVRAAGFSLIELMVTLVIIGVIALAGVPRLYESVSQSRVDRELSRLQGTLLLARNEAVGRGAEVVVCQADRNAVQAVESRLGQVNAHIDYPCLDDAGNLPDGIDAINWSETGWMVFVDRTADPDDGQKDVLLKFFEPVDAPVSVRVRGGGGFNTGEQIRFAEFGTAFGSNRTFFICDKNLRAEPKKLVINVYGRLQIKALDDSESCSD